jgi:autotransporter-associated beta strand protein
VTTLNGGTLAVQTLANGGVPSGIGASSNATSNLVFNGGSLRYLGAGNSTDRLFTLGPSGGTIRSSGTGPLNFTNPGALALQASNMSTTLTLSGNNTGANTFAPIIVDNPLGNTTGLTKSGSGLWAVTGNGTQTGVTTISGGTLQISSIANGGVVQTALNLYGPSNLTTTANTTTGDTVVGVSDASNLTDGQVASGLGIPNGTTITDVDYTNNLVTLSMAVTSNSTSGASVTFAGLAIANMTTDISGVTPGEVLVGPGLSTGTVVTNIDLVDNALILNQAPFQTNLNEVNLNTFTANPLGGSTNDPSNLIINGGTLQYVGPAGSTDRLFTVGSANATVDSSGTGALNFTNPGSLTFNGTASSVLTLTGNAAAVNTFAPVIGDPVSGNTSVVTSGTTTWMLTGLNTYSGGTTITGGTLQISSDSNLGTGNLTVGNGTAEYLLGFTSTRNISLTSANSTILVDSGQALTLNGNISGTGTLNFNGVGTLGGTNTYSGGTFLNGNVTLTSVTGLGTGSTTLENGSTLIEPNATTAGTGLGVNLIVATGATANFTFTSNASASYSGLLSGSNSSVLNLTAASSPLTLSGTTSQFANFTGTLNVLAVGSAGLRIFNSGTYTGFANMTLNLENTTGALFDHNTGQTVVIGNLSGNPGSQLNGDNSGTAGNTTWQIGGLNGTSTFAGNITDSGASNHSILNKVGTGILTLTGNNTFAGNATFTGGEVNFGSLTNLGTGILNFNGGGLQWATSSNTDISTRTVNFSTGGAVLDTNGNDVTLANAIGNGGAGGLTKIGNGNLFLNHAESYSGNTTISVGNIVLDVPGVLPTSSNVTVGSGAILNVNGQNATIGSLSGAGNVSLGSGSLTTGGNNLSPTFAGTISGVADGGLIKNGTGVLTLSGTSTYVGPTLVNAGNLDLTGTLSSSPVTVANGAILNGNGTIGGNLTLNQGGKISLGGPIANTLTVGNFTWNATSTTPGMQFSLTDTSSTLDILGNFTRGSSSGLGQYVFDFQGSGFFSGVYTLIDFGSVDPAFTLSDFSYVNLGTNESGAFSINANSLTFNIAPIPEPATWTLLIGAASLLAVWRKRRKGVR